MTIASSLGPSAEPDERPAPECGHPGCASAHARLTPWRARVLDILRGEGRALGAYDILDRLKDGSGRAIAPITVYRALDGLLEAGLVHRLASRNAYLACGGGHCVAQSTAFLICESCGDVGEVGSDALRGDLARLAEQSGFSARAETIEILGRCARCRAG